MVVICFKIRIFAQRQTSIVHDTVSRKELWFALKFVSLHKDKHHLNLLSLRVFVVICFKIRIFAQRQTSNLTKSTGNSKLWFALKFVSLHKDKHQMKRPLLQNHVVICFKIRIFAQRQTSRAMEHFFKSRLWFALKFVSLHKDKHRWNWMNVGLKCCDLL